MPLTKATYAIVKNGPADVTNYGADPTGVADSTSAIQNAINTGAVTVFFPAGTYRVSDTLTLGTGQQLVGESQTRSTIIFTANKPIITQNVPFTLRNIQINVFDQGAAFTSKLVVLNKTSSIVQGYLLIDNVTLFADSATATAFALIASNGAYIAFNNINGLVTRGEWGTSIEINADNSGSYIQGNSFTNLNLASRKFVSYPGAAVEIYGNLFDGVFQSQTGGLTDTNGTLVGPIWDQGSTGSYFRPKQRSLIVSDTAELPLEIGAPNRGAVGWSALMSNRFVQNGYLNDLNGSSQAELYEGNTYHKGGRGSKKFVDFCIGKQFDPRITLTNMTATGISTAGQASVLMSAMRTSETNSGAWMGLINTGCSLSKFPTLFMTVKNNNSSGNVAAAFENTEHKIGLFDSNSAQNGIYVEREWPGSGAKYWNQYLKIVAGGSVIYSQIINQNGTSTPITSGLLDTAHFNWWVDQTNIYFQLTYESYVQAFGFQSAQRSGINQWSGVITIPLSTAGLFNTQTVELNPMYISTPASFSAGELLLEWKRIELTYTDY